MGSRAATVAMTLLLAVSCSDSKPADKTAPAPAPIPGAAAAAIDASPTATPKETAPATANAAPPGWKEYRNAAGGYRLMAPPTPPKPTNYGAPGATDDLKLSGEEFRFADCFGQVMVLEYQGKETFDIEKGLDGGIESMLANINVKATDFGTTPDNGRVARQYSAEGVWKGTAIKGLGRGIAASETKAVVVNAFWKAADTTCPALGATFVNSLVAESK